MKPLLRFALTSTFALLLAGCRAPQTPPPSTGKVSPKFFSSYGGQFDGKRVNSELTGTVLLTTPRWSPNRDHPPLGPGAAIRLATKALSQTVTNQHQWRFSELTLKEPFDYYPDFPDGYWTYQVRYDGPTRKTDTPDLLMTDSLTFHVLMNGQVLRWKAITPK